MCTFWIKPYSKRILANHLFEIVNKKQSFGSGSERTQKEDGFVEYFLAPSKIAGFFGFTKVTSFSILRVVHSCC